jgi:glutamine synthetase
MREQSDTAEGTLGLDALARLAREGKIECVLVVFPDLYGRLMGKRLAADFFLDAVTAGRTFHACDYLLTADLEMEPVAGYQFANWAKGFGDLQLSPDLATLRAAAWYPSEAIVICDLLGEGGAEPISQAPRTMLKRQAARLAAEGYEPMAGSELEYYVYEDSYQDAFERGYANLTPCGRYRVDYNVPLSSRDEALHRAVRRSLKASGIGVEGNKGEWGVGQHELNLRFGDVVSNADNHCLFKQCVKESAAGLGLSVSFMAKPSAGRAGSSCHLHLSVWQDGRNLFGEQAARGQPPDFFRWFLGGWMAHACEMMVFYAPTVNSYKRFADGSWAPTRLAWGGDNRTVAFRTVGSGASARVECRIPGADCNPYLACAAALASGLDGITNRTEPPPMFDGDAYRAAELPPLPATLRDAVAEYARSDFAAAAFGGEVAEHFLRFYSSEQEAFDAAVTDWELRRYFERI